MFFLPKSIIYNIVGEIFSPNIKVLELEEIILISLNYLVRHQFQKITPLHSMELTIFQHTNIKPFFSFSIFFYYSEPLHSKIHKN